MTSSGMVPWPHSQSGAFARPSWSGAGGHCPLTAATGLSVKHPIEVGRHTRPGLLSHSARSLIRQPNRCRLRPHTRAPASTLDRALAPKESRWTTSSGELVLLVQLQSVLLELPQLMLSLRLPMLLELSLCHPAQVTLVL